MKSINTKQYYFSNLLKVLLAAFISITLFSCNNLSSASNQNQSGIEKPPPALDSSKGSIKIKLISPEAQNYRTALPQIPSITNFYDFVLKGKLGDKVYTLGSWYDSDNVDNENIELEIGDWELTLTADYNGFTFSDTKSVTVDVGTIQQVDFELSSSNITGGLNLFMHFDSSKTVDHVKYQLTKYPSGTVEDSGTLSIGENEYNKYIEYEKDNSNAISDGTYKLTLTFFGDSQEKILLNTYNELIRIKGGFTTSITRYLDLNAVFEITYYYPDDATIVSGSLVENYSINSKYDEILFPVLSKAGYDWQGWFTLPNGNGTSVTSLPSNSSGNITFYAYFTPHSYTISYELNGGVNDSANPVSYTIEDNITFGDATKANYIFDGWYTDPEFTKPITEINAGTLAEIITLFAKWKPGPTDVNITPGFPGNYTCNWSATGTSPNITISITIKDASGNLITPEPDSFSVQVCINGEPSGYTFTSQSFTYPSAISGFAAPSNSSFYVTFTIGTYTYDFYAVSP